MRPKAGADTGSGYSGTPLPKKLGIRPGSVVGLVGAPPDFGRVFGDLPVGASLRPGARGRCTLLIWFVRSPTELSRNIGRLAERTRDSHLWIAWQKGKAGPVGENAVREAGLAAGLVDFKICAFDDVWSGLQFARRESQ